ncbi:RHS repeat domain-containing protein [Winogradskyella luteola]|uniref:RHS repeat-associated core domain-containing protein n=1 Tax=Winogradskyella luteola TaxID=2828330 RepID=A0A9X1JPP6_9FLAO|nr:RHS repeat-associated core domain-containing protein [Winogradskyella luteola]MBV7270641.1 hypothetical protein [Winogradskyella luteola]
MFFGIGGFKYELLLGKVQKPSKIMGSCYPFGLKHKGYNDVVSANVNSVASRFMFGGKEFNDELGLDWYDVSARNYDPALGRWMNLDPLAEQMRRHSPYNYAFDNPIYFMDPDGMAPVGCPDGNCDDYAVNEDTVVNTNDNEVIVGENVTNDLGEINIGSVITNSAQGAHTVESDGKYRFYGFRVKGSEESGDFKGSFDLSGFSAGYDASDANLLLGEAHGDASVHSLKLQASGQYKDIEVDAEAALFEAYADGDLEIYSNPNGKEGFEAGGSVGVSAISLDFNPSFPIPFTNLRFTLNSGGSLGTANIGGRAAGTYDNETGDFEATAMIQAGFGPGFKIGGTITNRKQEINTNKKR